MLYSVADDNGNGSGAAAASYGSAAPEGAALMMRITASNETTRT